MALLADPTRVIPAAPALSGLGFATLARGELGQADEFFQKSLTTPTTFWLLEKPRNLVGLAFSALERKKLDAAQGYVDEARAYSETRAMKTYYPLVAYADALVRVARADNERALDEFTRAEEFAMELQMRPIVWQACAGAAKLLDALGRADEAERKRGDARAMIEEIANLFEDEKWRAAFAEPAMAKVAV